MEFSEPLHASWPVFAHLPVGSFWPSSLSGNPGPGTVPGLGEEGVLRSDPSTLFSISRQPQNSCKQGHISPASALQAASQPSWPLPSRNPEPLARNSFSWQLAVLQPDSGPQICSRPPVPGTWMCSLPPDNREPKGKPHGAVLSPCSDMAESRLLFRKFGGLPRKHSEASSRPVALCTVTR